MEQTKEQVVEKKQETRVAYGKVAIVGCSGSGKSYLSKTLDPDTTGYINVERKPLPFKQIKPFKYHGQPKTWSGFIKCIEDYSTNPEIKYIVIDSQTAALDILNREMQNSFISRLHRFNSIVLKSVDEFSYCIFSVSSVTL